MTADTNTTGSIGTPHDPLDPIFMTQIYTPIGSLGEYFGAERFHVVSIQTEFISIRLMGRYLISLCLFQYNLPASGQIHVGMSDKLALIAQIYLTTAVTTKADRKFFATFRKPEGEGMTLSVLEGNLGSAYVNTPPQAYSYRSKNKHPTGQWTKAGIILRNEIGNYVAKCRSIR